MINVCEDERNDCEVVNIHNINKQFSQQKKIVLAWQIFTANVQTPHPTARDIAFSVFFSMVP